MTVEGSFRPVIVRFPQELLRQPRICDGTLRTVQQWLGNAGVIDLLMLIAYYGSLLLPCRHWK
jgi:hypothetical protein